ncbi:MAG: hypothetical protein IT204_11475 [Fimbriimonadaceae bacterium]|nr:hypothetical protein [Fimbriimonadaceae bacterium]
MAELDGRTRLRLAGLDLDLPGRAAAAAGARFCAYTGRELTLQWDDGGTADSARLGLDAFTTAGHLLRYEPGGAAARLLDPTLREWRQSVDLFASAALPVPDSALRRAGDEPPVENWQLLAAGMGEVRGVVVRHGRLYALNSYGAESHVVQAWRLPRGLAAGGWRPPRVRGGLLPAQGWRPGSELRVSESLVYLNLVDRLGGWHAGHGEHWIDWPWPGGSAVLARLAGDRLLLVRQDANGLVAEVYDLAAVASGPCRPLPGQARLLGELPAGQAQPLWAEAHEAAFWVLSADGRIHCFPFDGPPQEVFGNVEEVRLGPPAFRGTGQQADLVAFCSNDRGRWLLELPLDRTRPYRFTPLRERAVASYELPPCFLGGRQIDAHAATAENVQALRCLTGQCDQIDERAEVPGTAGSRVDGLQRLLCGGQELLVVEYTQSTRRFWFCDAGLQRLTVEPPFPQLRAADEVRLLWDAAGIYLCDLANGVVHARSPQA